MITGAGLVTILLFTIGAGSLLMITSSSGEPSTPVEEYGYSTTGYQPVIVDDVKVEVGIGSPVTVRVIVSRNLPDVSSQAEHTEMKQDESNFIITLVAMPITKDCIRDTLPFKMDIILNTVELPAGSYLVTVNGSRVNFKLETGTSTSSLRTAEMPIGKEDIQVDSVNIDYGVSSPIPVHAIVSGNLPSACTQLGKVRLHREGATFLVQLLTYIPGQTDCSSDTLPPSLKIPLNIVNLLEAPYEANVNGITASFDPGAVFTAPAKVLEERTLSRVEDVERIDAFVTEQMQRHGLPGLALARVNRDQVIFMKGYRKAAQSGRDTTPLDMQESFTFEQEAQQASMAEGYQWFFGLSVATHHQYNLHQLLSSPHDLQR